MTIRWLPAATRDLGEISSYLHEHLPSFAESTMEEIFRLIESLESMPFRGKPAGTPNTRQFVLPHLPYIVFYEVQEDTIKLLYIRHGARKRRVP